MKQKICLSKQLLVVAFIAILMGAGAIFYARYMLLTKNTLSSRASFSSIGLSQVKVSSELSSASSEFIVEFNTSDLKAQLAPALLLPWKERGEFVFKLLEKRKQQNSESMSNAGLKGSCLPSVCLVTQIASAATISKAQSINNAIAIRPQSAGYIDPEPTSDLLSTTSPNSAQAVAWNITFINADAVWNKGIKGEGITVGIIDTGALYTHEALLGSYRGNKGGGVINHDYSWFDSTQICPANSGPCDLAGHGTHVTGIAAGGGVNQIGVAPGSKWISANGCAGACLEFDLRKSAYWMIAPTKSDGTAPDPAMRPEVINNSWRFLSTEMFQSEVDMWQASGIIPVFAAGNSGPVCATLSSTGGFQNVISIGSLRSTSPTTGTTSSFSSRGPRPMGPNVIGPDVLAPGEFISSAWNSADTAYLTANGTSQAAPHVSGMIALLLSANPALKGQFAPLWTAITSTAHPMGGLTCGGTAAANNTGGHGSIDALAAIQYLSVTPTPTPIPTLIPTLTPTPVIKKLYLPLINKSP